MPMWRVVSGIVSAAATGICRMKRRENYVHTCENWSERREGTAARARVEGNLVQQMGLTKRFQIGILVGQFLQAMVELNGVANVGLGGR